MERSRYQSCRAMVSRGAQLYKSAIERKTSAGTRGATGSKVVTAALAKKGWVWKRLRYSPPQPRDAAYQGAKYADWLTLKLWATCQLICLKYLDESGFERTSRLGYSYIRRGQQKPIYQPRQRGRRISVLGLWQPKASFEYGMVVGGFNTKRYLKLMEWQASKAEQHLAQAGQITVIIQDGASFHKSLAVQQHWRRWQQQGLFLFFLPPYSPQMNRIEEEWLHLKREQLASQVFEDEYEVVKALIDGIEARGQRGGYEVERFRFN